MTKKHFQALADHSRAKAIGQCWANECSADSYNEIFISPELGGPGIGPRIMGVLAHEPVHATVGVAAAHKGPFKRAPLAVGLCGKMIAVTEQKTRRRPVQAPTNLSVGSHR